MFENAKYIWLSEEKYPNLQKSSISFFSPEVIKYKFGVAAFKKEFIFDKKVKKADITVFGDTRFYLDINSEFVGMGPVPAGGDFVMPEQYASFFSVDIDKNVFDVYARVQLTNVIEADSSVGRGGFVFSAKLIFDDGTVETVVSDKTWLSRRENEYVAPRITDYTLDAEQWKYAVEIDSAWNLKLSPIKNLCEECVSSCEYTVDAFAEKEFYTELDKIYSAYVKLCIDAHENCEYEITVLSSEINGISQRKHSIKGIGSRVYRSNEMDSIGEYKLIIKNNGDTPVKVKTDILFVCYPSEEKGMFKCSDDMLNRIYELGKWTVKICRQSIELDSPVHFENLLCTGDYMIESLVNNMTTGDYSLTRFDILRMGRYFVATKGYKYHTTYALMWVSMLYDYYMYTGDETIFFEVVDGLEYMLERFKSFENSDGILENMTNYMFVDWMYIDGYGLNHPPRALGETFMNACYFKAVSLSAKIYEIMGNKKKAEEYAKKSASLKEAFNIYFYDDEKQLYFDGRNLPNEVNRCMPENSKKRYYTIYSNTLAVLYNLCDISTGKRILDEILSDESKIIAQPYFMHFVLEAVYKTGLFDKYGIKLIKRWESMVLECEKGMKEVGISFEGYVTDYSHGWGSTPTYQMPSKLLGIEILEPGFKRIKINPCLYGLEWADIKVPTPFGVISCSIKDEDKYEIEIPDGIMVEN